jgi:mRNA interferase MazF
MVSEPAERGPLERGAIHWCDLGPVVGAGSTSGTDGTAGSATRSSAPAKRRPVLVVQANSYNRSAIGTVIVAVITSKVQSAELPGNVFVPAAASGLPRDSAVNVSQVLTLDRASLGERAGTLPAYLQGDVDRGLRLVLGL